MLTGAEFPDIGKGIVGVLMTGTGAIPQFRYGVEPSWAIYLLVFVSFIVSRMAPRTIGLVGGKSPGYGLRVTGMAIGTVQVLTMLTRIIRRLVEKIIRRPRHGRVAVTAVNCGSKVSRIFPCGGSTVMATLAVTRDSGVGETRWQPSDSGMANITILACYDMVPGLTLLDSVVVAALAVTRYSRVVKTGWRPGDHRMANITVLVSGQMISRLAFLDRVVVAALAVTCYSRVVKIGRRPGNGRMADITVLVGRQVVSRLTLLYRIVVATLAITGNFRVVEVCRQPGRCRMAGITILVSFYMIPGFSFLDGVVVTALAIARYSGVVKIGWQPGER